VAFEGRRRFHFQDFKVHCDTTCPVTHLRISGARSLPSINLFRVVWFVIRNRSLSSKVYLFIYLFIYFNCL